jgi:hypothetical protein
VLLDAFLAPIAQLPSVDHHLTKLLLLVGLSSGAPVNNYVLLEKPFQPHTQGLPLQPESYKSFVRITNEIRLPTGLQFCPSQTLTFPVLEKYHSSGNRA